MTNHREAASVTSSRGVNLQSYSLNVSLSLLQTRHCLVPVVTLNQSILSRHTKTLYIYALPRSLSIQLKWILITCLFCNNFLTCVHYNLTQSLTHHLILHLLLLLRLLHQLEAQAIFSSSFQRHPWQLNVTWKMTRHLMSWKFTWLFHLQVACWHVLLSLSFHSPTQVHLLLFLLMESTLVHSIQVQWSILHHLLWAWPSAAVSWSSQHELSSLIVG